MGAIFRSAAALAQSWSQMEAMPPLVAVEDAAWQILNHDPKSELVICKDIFFRQRKT